MILGEIPLYPQPGGIKGFGPLGLESNASTESVDIFVKIISTAIGLITIIAIVWFVLQLIIGAVEIISSGGDKAKLQTARAKITSALIGLIMVIAGIFIAEFVGWLMGIDLLNFKGLINAIKI